MNFWSPFPFVRIVGAFVAGILTAQYWSPLIDLPTVLMMAVGAVLILCGARVIKLDHRIVGAWALLSLMILGVYYTNLSMSLTTNITEEKFDGFAGKIVSYPENRGQYKRLELLTQSILKGDSMIPAKLRMLLYVRDSSECQLNYADFILVNGQAQLIQPPSNPSEFDFSRFWSRKGISHQAFIAGNDYEVLQRGKGNLMLRKSYEIRDYCRAVLDRAITDPQNEAIAMALILGVKDGLDSDIKEAYAASGAMHVLAVSGLHVGILYLFILYLFRPIKGKKYGDLITGLFSLLILWIYALITGFSPSVQRAVVMFSIFIVGRMLGRSRNIYNSLAFSAFILLLINPLMIYEVGFQLSYLAVFGIVFLHPRLYQLWSPSNVVINKAWELSCVSISAQLATFPLGLYYFHQFPTLFLISNLVVIPMAFLILILGISLLLISVTGIPILNVFSTLINWALWLMNELIFAIQGFDFSLIQGIQLSTIQTVLLYGLILGMIVLFLYRNFKSLVLSVLVALAIVFIEVEEVIARSQKKEVVVYHVNGKSLIDLRSGLDAELNVGEGDFTSSIKYIVKPDRMKSNLISKDIKIQKFRNWSAPVAGIQVREWMDKTIIRVHDSTWSKFDWEQSIEVDILIISNNAVNSLEQLANTFKAGLILIDSSNGYFGSNALSKEALSLDIDVHVTRNQGALTIKL